MTINLDAFEKMLAELPDNEERRKLAHLIAETREFDQRIEHLRFEEEKKLLKLKRRSLLLAPTLVAGAIGCIWYVLSALADGSVSYRGKVVLKSAEPLVFWLHMAWPIVGAILLPVCTFYIVRSVFFRSPDRAKAGF